VSVGGRSDREALAPSTLDARFSCIRRKPGRRELLSRRRLADFDLDRIREVGHRASSFGGALTASTQTVPVDDAFIHHLTSQVTSCGFDHATSAIGPVVSTRKTYTARRSDPRS
jgi:hypothetical protein